MFARGEAAILERVRSLAKGWPFSFGRESTVEKKRAKFKVLFREALQEKREKAKKKRGGIERKKVVGVFILRREEKG